MAYGGSVQMGASVIGTFQALDEDQNDHLSEAEIQDWLAALDINYASLDADGSGGISADEFSSSVFPITEDANANVTLEGNRALGVLDSAQWHFDILGERRVNMSGHGGGILLLSILTYKRKASLVMLSGTHIVNNAAGVGGGIAHACAQDPGQSTQQDPIIGRMVAAGDVVVAENTAVMNDGAYNMKSLIQDFKIEGGDSRVPWGDGGGLWSLDFKAWLLSGVSFRDNHANFGGAVCLRRNSALLLSRATFSGNSAESNGGALSAFQGSVITAEGARFAGNSAGVYGGAIATEVDSNAILRICILHSNSAHDGGGLVGLEESQVSIERCRAVGNIAKVEGGGKHICKAPDILSQMNDERDE